MTRLLAPTYIYPIEPPSSQPLPPLPSILKLVAHLLQQRSGAFGEQASECFLSVRLRPSMTPTRGTARASKDKVGLTHPTVGRHDISVH